ncbi:MAG: imidazole glycerol phosphate synthase subunit HisH [Hyphomicrobiales bacterium]|nr:imidazole glycerol phosphate synthase subunit HisH [Hyphomicrobiales bacterium]
MITIIDSGIANIGSVLSALRRIEAPAETTRQPEMVARAQALLLPGVGAFGDGMASLEQNGLVDPIRRAAARGVPVLGICLGMQLLAEGSDEFGAHAGLGLVSGRAIRLQPQRPGERVPNIGWCDIRPRPEARLFKGIPPGASVYFAHSYHVVCHRDEDVAAEMAYGNGRITVAIERGRVFGAQFHPEKSQDAGLAMLAAFADYCRNL